jgi:hypothetical protein
MTSIPYVYFYSMVPQYHEIIEGEGDETYWTWWGHQ